MPNKKISSLTDGSPSQSSDQIAINRGGTNFRVNASGMVLTAPAADQTITGAHALKSRIAVTGTTTGSVIAWSFASDPNGVTGYGAGGLLVEALPTSGNANFRVANPTGGNITPGAMTLNFRVIF